MFLSLFPEHCHCEYGTEYEDKYGREIFYKVSIEIMDGKALLANKTAMLYYCQCGIFGLCSRRTH